MHVPLTINMNANRQDQSHTYMPYKCQPHAITIECQGSRYIQGDFTKVDGTAVSYCHGVQMYSANADDFQQPGVLIRELPIFATVVATPKLLQHSQLHQHGDFWHVSVSERQ